MDIIFLGQAPAQPGSKHAIPGTYLHPWLTHIGLDQEFIEKHCHFYALVGTFPGSNKGSHKPPTPLQVLAHRPNLVQAFSTIKPDLIVPVGRQAIDTLLPIIGLEDVIGKRYMLDPYNALGHSIPCVPLAHPSGRSTWTMTHKELVTASLELLAKEVCEQKLN